MCVHVCAGDESSCTHTQPRLTDPPPFHTTDQYKLDVGRFSLQTDTRIVNTNTSPAEKSGSKWPKGDERGQACGVTEEGRGDEEVCVAFSSFTRFKSRLSTD